MRKERGAFLVLLAAVVMLGGLIVAGCEPAEDSETTEADETTETTAAEETTTTSEPDDEDGETTTTTGDGEESVAPVSEQFQACSDCHSDFNRFLEDSEVLTSNFSHGLHLNKGFQCEDCHSVPTHKPDEIERPTMLACFSCHGQEEDAMATGACGDCHPPDFPLVPGNHQTASWLPAEQPGLVQTVSSQHSDLATEDRAYCEMCHAQDFCMSCHQTEMPHGDDWMAAHPQTVRSVGTSSCTSCHPQEYLCNDCHHTGFEAGETPWRLQHPPIVRETGAEGCFEQCHNPLECARCHITGEFEPDLEPSG